MKNSFIALALLASLWTSFAFAETTEVVVVTPPQDSNIIPVMEDESTRSSAPAAIPAAALRDDTVHHSMITHHGEGVFSMDPRFANARKDLVDMNDLSYAIGKGLKHELLGNKDVEAKQKAKADSLLEKFKGEGWEFKTFEGISGVENPQRDIVGFVAYNALKNQMNVIFRGSTTAADWETNFDAIKVKAKDVGLNLEGMVHKGFAQKYMSARENMVKAIEGFWEKMSDHAKKAVKIIVSGHSKGGALATLGTADIGINLTKKLFGEGYNNARDNQVYMWSLSGARTGDAEAIDDINAKIGVYNMIRQNPLHDPAPNVVLGRTGQRILDKIPVVGHYLAENFAGYKSVGTLALTNDTDTYKEILPALKANAIRTVDDFGNQVIHATEKKPLEAIKSFGSAAKRMGSRFVSTILAPLHQGSTLNDETGEFSTNTVHMDTARLLHDGWEHKKQSQESRGETYIYDKPFGSGVSEYSSPKPAPAPAKEEGILSRAATAVKEGVTNTASKVKETFKKLKFW